MKSYSFIPITIATLSLAAMLVVAQLYSPIPLLPTLANQFTIGPLLASRLQYFGFATTCFCLAILFGMKPEVVALLKNGCT